MKGKQPKEKCPVWQNHRILCIFFEFLFIRMFDYLNRDNFRRKCRLVIIAIPSQRRAGLREGDGKQQAGQV